MGQRNALVRLPLVVQRRILNEDEEIVVLALVVDLGLGGFSLGHFEWFCWGVLLLCVCEG